MPVERLPKMLHHLVNSTVMEQPRGHHPAYDIVARDAVTTSHTYRRHMSIARPALDRARVNAQHRSDLLNGQHLRERREQALNVGFVHWCSDCDRSDKRDCRGITRTRVMMWRL